MTILGEIPAPITDLILSICGECLGLPQNLNSRLAFAWDLRGQHTRNDRNGKEANVSTVPADPSALLRLPHVKLPRLDPAKTPDGLP